MSTSAQSSAVDEEIPRPLRKDAARNRDALLAAGRLVFAERGLDASLDDIARRAGVGVGTAYRNFANKYDLAKAIFVQSVDEIVALAERATAADRAWDGIVTLIEGSAEAQIADRGLRDILMGLHDDEVFDHINDRLAPLTDTLVARAKTEGTVRDDVKSSDLWVVLMMLCTVADLTVDLAPTLWRRYLPVLLAGIRPGVDPPDVAALDDATLRAAIRSHKKLIRELYSPSP